MFVCIRLDLFDWVTHTGARLPRTGVFLDVGATSTSTPSQAQSFHRPPDGHAHRRAAKGKATLSKQIAGASAVPLGYKAESRCVSQRTALCAVDTIRRRLFCEIAR